MAGSIDYSVTVGCSRELVWKTLLDWENWPNWRGVHGVYGKVYWKEGEPWQVGSRFVFEHHLHIGPIPVSFDATLVVTKVRPLEELAWINHGAGITVEQTTELYSRGPQETVVSTSIDFLGKLLKGAPPGVDAEGRLRELIVNFYNALAEEAVKSSEHQLLKTESSAG